MTYVALGESSFIDVPVVVGPFRDPKDAVDAAHHLIWLGYNAYYLEVKPLKEVRPAEEDKEED